MNYKVISFSHESSPLTLKTAVSESKTELVFRNLGLIGQSIGFLERLGYDHLTHQIPHLEYRNWYRLLGNVNRAQTDESKLKAFLDMIMFAANAAQQQQVECTRFTLPDFQSTYFGRRVIVAQNPDYIRMLFVENIQRLHQNPFLLLQPLIGPSNLVSLPPTKEWREKRSILVQLIIQGFSKNVCQNVIRNVVQTTLDLHLNQPRSLNKITSAISREVLCRCLLRLESGFELFDNNLVSDFFREIAGIRLSTDPNGSQQLGTRIEAMALKLIDANSKSLFEDPKQNKTWLTELLRLHAGKKEGDFTLQECQDMLAKLKTYIDTVSTPDPALEKLRYLVREAMLLPLVGFDTTSSLMTTAVRKIEESPLLKKELIEDIQRGNIQLDANVNILYKKQEKLDLIDRIILESLRWAPPASIDPEEIAEKFDPFTKGTWVFVDIFQLHRNPKYYQNPDEFLPDRWRTIDLAKYHNDCKYVPFKQGIRICAGKQFALVEAKFFIHTMYANYLITMRENQCSTDNLNRYSTVIQYTSPDDVLIKKKDPRK